MHPEAVPLQPETTLKTLLRNRVNCVIVGSFGAIAQGVDLDYTDIDLCIEMSPENIRATAAALVELDAIEGTGVEAKTQREQDHLVELDLEPKSDRCRVR